MAAWLEKAKEGESGTVILSPGALGLRYPLYDMRLLRQMQCSSLKKITGLFVPQIDQFFRHFFKIWSVSFLCQFLRALARTLGTFRRLWCRGFQPATI